MPISVICSKCSQQFAVKDQYAGKLIRCPGCSEDILVPHAKPAPKARPQKAASKDKNATAPSDELSAELDIKRPIAAKRMSGKLKAVLIVTGSIALLMCVSCGIWATWEEQAKKSALIYNQELVQAQDRLAKSRVAVADNIDRSRLIPVEAVEKGALRRRNDDLQATITALRGEMAGWKPPSGARNLHQSYQKYLDYVETELPHFTKAIALVADPRLLDEQRESKAVKILDDLDAGEKRAFDEIEKQQREFAGRYGILLMPRVRPTPQIIMTPQMRELIENSKKYR